MSTPQPEHRRWPWVLAGAAALLALLIGLGEWRGWPFLAKPTEQRLTQALERPVRFAPEGSKIEGFRVRFIGGLRVASAYFEIAAPDWSREPHMLLARDVDLHLRYLDLWRMRRGDPLRIARLEARQLDARLERRDDQHVSWRFGARPAQAGAAAQPPVFDRLVVREGQVSYVDTPRALSLQGVATLRDSSAPAAAAASAPAGAASDIPAGLHLSATGRHRQADFKLQLDSAAVIPWIGGDADTPPVAVRIDARSGASRLNFDGSARDVLRLDGLAGRFGVEGVSLARLGDALGVTLPTTERFRLEGRLRKQADLWSVVVDRGEVGASRMNGQFTYDAARERPLLAGRLRGALLRFADLAPAVGAPVPGVAPPPRAGHVLPDREFDLPSMRAMDANVLVDVERVDLGAAFGEPLAPLRTHLRLTDGVLVLDDLDTRTSQGRARGRIELDSRPTQPLWQIKLRWGDIALERWFRQTRGADKPPYVAGRLAGRAELRGRGRSTARMLSTLDGEVLLRVRSGQVSHLAIELAGIDIAESLGLLIKGDETLPISCAVGQWVVEKGVARPRVMVVDTPDSTVWIDGSVSLANERLDLKAQVAPKDFSLLALRTPLRVRGPFTAPEVSLEKGPLARKLVMAGLLAALQPLAALLPGIDSPGGGDTADGEAGCERLIRQVGTPAVPAKVR